MATSRCGKQTRSERFHRRYTSCFPTTIEAFVRSVETVDFGLDKSDLNGIVILNYSNGATYIASFPLQVSIGWV